MLFAAEEAAGGPKRFAARNVDSAMRARNHGLDRGRRRTLLALARKTGQHEVSDDYCDDEKEELAHAAMAGCLRRGSRRVTIIPARGKRASDREAGRGDWIRTSDSCVPNAVLYQAELHPESNRSQCEGKSASGTLVVALDREGRQF